MREGITVCDKQYRRMADVLNRFVFFYLFVHPRLFDNDSGTEEFQFKDRGHLENLRDFKTQITL